ncbi:uncharacterized protein Tsen15 [Eurosta solidaginis]|uniref:uncharacterized protein Tsen15 n=1 Tax=Eurosta solidaginis TaxID=178769 RepID=UPI0035305C3A
MSSIDALRDFQTLGCKDQLKCALGGRVFLDLECDKRITCLQKCYDSELNVAYIRGQRDDAFVAFLPILSSQPLNFLDLENLQKKLMNFDSRKSDVTLAICDTSSNILYYQVTTGFGHKK